MIDLNQESGFVYGGTIPPLSARVNVLIDSSLVAQNEAQPKRTYLGGSRIGEDCSRRLVYEYTHTPHDPDKAFSGQTLRIFAAGQGLRGGGVMNCFIPSTAQACAIAEIRDWYGVPQPRRANPVRPGGRPPR